MAETGKEDIILGTNWLLEHNLEVDWHAYRLYFTRCPPSCQIKKGLVKAKRATKKLGYPNPSIQRIKIVLQKSNYSILLQKLEKALPDQKVGNTIVLLAQTISKCPELTTQRLNAKQLKAWAKYKALIWAKEDVLEDSDQAIALPFIDLEEDGVYLVRCLNTGILQALKLYNDNEEGINIYRTETTKPFIANTLAPKKGPIKAPMGKQTKHINLQRLAKEASKGQPKLPFEEIVPKEY